MRWGFETFESKKERKTQWHKWFAWRPVQYKTEDNQHKWLWLERIYRRAIGYSMDGFWEWEYAADDFEVLKSGPSKFKSYRSYGLPPPPPPSTVPSMSHVKRSRKK